MARSFLWNARSQGCAAASGQGEPSRTRPRRSHPDGDTSKPGSPGEIMTTLRRARPPDAAPSTAASRQRNGRLAGSGSGVSRRQIRTIGMPRWCYFAATFYVLQGMAALGIADRLLYGEWLGKPGNKLTQGLNLLLILSSLALFGRGFHRIRLIQTGAILAIGLAGFLLCSAAWSIAPMATAREAI